MTGVTGASGITVSVTGCADIDGDWSDWSEWSRCSVTCGDGHELRTRQCDNPEPLYGGALCTEDTQEKKSCTNPACREYLGAPLGPLG